MKKLLVLFLAVLFVAPMAFSKDPSSPTDKADLSVELQRAVREQSPQDWEYIVHLRLLWGKLEKENVSLRLENIIFMADNFIRDYAKNPRANTFDGFEPKNEGDVIRVVAQIEKPIVAGWGETIIISEYIKENSDELKSGLFAEERIAYLGAFREILVKYSQPQYSKGAQMLLGVGYLESYRKGIEGMKDLNSSHLVQSTVSLMDGFMWIKEKNPAVAKRLAREIVKPVKAGWFDGEVDVFYIITNHACEVWQVEDELEAFAETLKELNK